MKKLLTPAELGELLGLATQTIYNRLSTGENLPPCVRIGRAVRFPLAAVATWVEQLAKTAPAKPVSKSKCRMGLPRKAEQIARRRGGVA